MKVLLVNPKLKTWSPDIHPPLGLAYIAAALEDARHIVRILDMNSRKVSDNELQDQVRRFDVVGITGLVTEYNEVLRLIGIIKEHSDAVVIIGGPLATTHTKKVMESSLADYAVIGEGEKTVVELVDAIRDKSGVYKVKGIAYRNHDIHINPMREPIVDLDAIPYPARHLLDMSRYSTHHFKSFGLKLPCNVKSTTMVTSRGCPYLCSYCFKDVWGQKWRGRSPENIITEMELLNRDYGFNGFVFNDDTFVVDRKRAIDFCKILFFDSSLRGRIKWYCNGRVNLMDVDLLGVMAQSGCVGIAYGIESGNQEILDSIKKQITLEEIERVVAETKAVGIHITGYFMLGIIGDSKETIQQTIDFARKLDLDYYGFTMCSPIVGTPMHKAAMEQGLVPYQELSDWSLHSSVNLTVDCTREDLERFNEVAFREFTIEKRYGKNYLSNPKLWLDGFRSVAFLTGKRDYKELISKSWSVIKK